MAAQSVINWTVVCQLSWQYLRRSTTVVYHSDRQALSTARFRRAGQLATADLFHCSCYCCCKVLLLLLSSSLSSFPTLSRHRGVLVNRMSISSVNVLLKLHDGPTSCDRLTSFALQTCAAAVFSLRGRRPECSPTQFYHSGERSIIMSVCLPVCLSVRSHVSTETTMSKLRQIFGAR